MRLIVAIVLALLLAAIVAAPLAAQAWGLGALPLYAAFSWVCHQRPLRTWTIGPYPLAVCVRCLGIYAGALAGSLAGLPFHRRLFYAAGALLAAEWLIEFSGWVAPPSVARFAVGLLAGFFAVPALWRNPQPPISVLQEGTR